MFRNGAGASVALTGALILTGVAANAGRSASASLAVHKTPRLHLIERRQSKLDLEIGGEVAGSGAGKRQFVSRAELLTLPQVSYQVSDDANFKRPVEIGGVLLEDLASGLNVESDRLLMVAICSDQYHAHYPREYVAAHHPVLVLKIDGKGPDDWPKDAEGHSVYLGPYLISHAKFATNASTMTHEFPQEDEPQIPWGVERLEFRDETKVFGAIAPRGPRAGDPSAKAAFQIARQNCYRCHNMGDEGGKKAGIPWQVLAIWASTSPERFAAYVRNPQAVNPKSQMEGSPHYDAAAMKALIEYFRAFAGAGQQ